MVDELDKLLSVDAAVEVKSMVDNFMAIIDDWVKAHGGYENSDTTTVPLSAAATLYMLMIRATQGEESVRDAEEKLGLLHKRIEVVLQ
jgi:hypothetical protein